MNICLVCNGDRDIDMKAIRELCRDRIVSEMVNPGGRELIFKDRGRLQLSDQCNACNAERIRDFLK